jgi:hypothetical protein
MSSQDGSQSLLVGPSSFSRQASIREETPSSFFDFSGAFRRVPQRASGNRVTALFARNARIVRAHRMRRPIRAPRLQPAAGRYEAEEVAAQVERGGGRPRASMLAVRAFGARLCQIDARGAHRQRALEWRPVGGRRAAALASPCPSAGPSAGRTCSARPRGTSGKPPTAAGPFLPSVPTGASRSRPRPRGRRRHPTRARRQPG